MHDSPRSAAGTPADVRHPEGGLRAYRTVDEGGVPFYVDRVGQVTARARREVADVNLPLPEPAGRPVQAPADGVPALLVCSPSSEDRHVGCMGPQLLVRASVAVDEPLDSPSALIRELVPSRHSPSPNTLLVARLRTHPAPGGRSQADASRVSPGSEASGGKYPGQRAGGNVRPGRSSPEGAIEEFPLLRPRRRRRSRTSAASATRRPAAPGSRRPAPQAPGPARRSPRPVQRTTRNPAQGWQADHNRSSSSPALSSQAATPGRL